MRVRTLVLAALIAAPLGGVAHARPIEGRVDADAAIEALQARVTGPIAVARHAASAVPHRLSGFASRPYAGGPEAAARSFLGELAPLFGFDASELVPIEQETLGGVTSVRLEQRIDGAPVLGRTVVVTVDAAGRATSVTDVPEAVVVAPRTHEIAARQAIDAALEALDVQESALGAPPQARKVIMAAGTEGRLAWRVSAVVVPLAWHMAVVIDAETGAVLHVSNDVRHD